MGRIGIVNNPRARRNRRRPRTAAALRDLVGSEGTLLDVHCDEDTRAALRTFRRDGVSLLAVNGGDGTLSRLATALPEAWGGPPWPKLVPLPGGSMNNVAHAHGYRGSPQRCLRRLLRRLQAGEPLHAVERDLLLVEGGGRPAQLGFLFATGAAVRFLDLWNAREGSGPWRAAALLGATLASALFGGRLAREVTRREALRVVAEGEEWPAREWLAVLAGAVPGLGFGSRPFSRCDEQPGFFHAFGVTASPRRLLLALPALWRGHPWRRHAALDAVTRDLLLEPQLPLRYTLDGDLYLSEGPLRVRNGPALEVVVDTTRPPRRPRPGDGLTAREFAR